MTVPIVPMAHEYLVTRPGGLPLDMPTMRDPSLLVYFRPESGGLVMGGYERDPAPWSLDGIPPDFNGRLLEEDWPRFEPLLENAIRRVPSLAEMEVVRLINGPEAFTPDGEFILGPTDVRGFWVAAGFCAHGLAGAGGMGKLVAEWIVEGTPSLDVWHMDSRRFGAAYTTASTRSRARPRSTRPTTTSSTPGTSARPGVRSGSRPPTRGCRSSAPPSARSPAGSGRTGSTPMRRTATRGCGRAAGRDATGRRRSAPSTRACREAAALFDESSFAKIEVAGPGAAELLEWLCDNRVARDVGAITYTQMLNAKGGIECDFTVTRLAEDRFRIVTGTAFGRHDLAWIRQHAPEDGSVTVEDVTSKYACIGIWGPASREILAPLTTDPLDFSYMRARELDVGPVPCLALRVTYVGELGWELYCPSEFGLRLWDAIWAAGASTGSWPAATRRSTRSGSRRAIASGARTSPPTTRPRKRDSASRSSSTRTFLGKEALLRAG